MICQAGPRQRLRQDEDEERREHGADRRHVAERTSEERDEVREREGGREHADQEEEPHAVADGARRALSAATGEREERGGEEAEDVDVRQPERHRRVVVGRDLQGQHRDADDRDDLRQLRRGRSLDLGRDRLEEVDGEERHEDRQDGGRVDEGGALEQVGDRLARVPERDVGREGEEQPVHRATSAQEHRQRDGEREDRAEERRSRPEILHSPV